ncbi:unnamed protein product [Darwinula stevensoni]|uniref:Major facilitator superfamily (MFS) profile domain-containing protein n=1 Tax=Darwinula stevensoni TaxID=69355 RepID=A0A7R8XD88_9CRUS|nr:unnamed protein product [Darwinula stevensoni]CAG0889596.1 unnamed protein product [Darwinula stevensoni]
MAEPRLSLNSFVDLIEDWMWFVTVCYLLRILQGVGYAFFATTIFALVAHFFPKSMGTVLYSDFRTVRDFQSVDLPRMKPFFFHMGSWVVCVAIIVLSSAFAFFYPVLQPHVEAVFGMTESTTALLYLVFTGSYGVTGILSGYIADHFAKWRKAQLGIAFLAIAFSFLLLGPASFLHIPRSLGLLIGSLVLTGASLSFSLIPTFGIINEEARLAGYDDNIGTASLMSGMWNSMFSLGEAVGPAISGALYDVSDFSTAAIVFAGICFGTGDGETEKGVMLREIRLLMHTYQPESMLIRIVSLPSALSSPHLLHGKPFSKSKTLFAISSSFSSIVFPSPPALPPY